jgi:hypothetical protein
MEKERERNSLRCGVTEAIELYVAAENRFASKRT